LPAVIEPMVALCEASGCFKRPAGDQQPWRRDNPLPLPTERETFVLSQGLPVYRVLYERNSAPLPTLQTLEEWLEAADNPATAPAAAPAATPSQ
jgi:tRNA (guanine-N7-)-methyltransferase